MRKGYTCINLAFLYKIVILSCGMDNEHYSRWDAHFEESNQDGFKEEVKNWLRSNKDEIKRLCEAEGISVISSSPYGMLAGLMKISLSSINNWMSLKAQKPIPDERVKEIRRIMAEVKQDRSGAASASPSAAASRDEFVQLLKSRLTFEAIGKFYTEAERAGMSLDAYLGSLLK